MNRNDRELKYKLVWLLSDIMKSQGKKLTQRKSDAIFELLDLPGTHIEDTLDSDLDESSVPTTQANFELGRLYKITAGKLAGKVGVFERADNSHRDGTPIVLLLDKQDPRNIRKYWPDAKDVVPLNV